LVDLNVGTGLGFRPLVVREERDVGFGFGAAVGLVALGAGCEGAPLAAGGTSGGAGTVVTAVPSRCIGSTTATAAAAASPPPNAEYQAVLHHNGDSESNSTHLATKKCGRAGTWAAANNVEIDYAPANSS
jgi:hypothetical protein